MYTTLTPPPPRRCAQKSPFGRGLDRGLEAEAVLQSSIRHEQRQGTMSGTSRLLM